MQVEIIENGFNFPPFTIPLRQYRAEEARAVVIVVPAMGTASSFYQPFAEKLASRGFSVMMPELPGTGASLPRPSWKVDYGYRELVEIYLPQLVRSAAEAGPGLPVVLIGHSLGAHAGTMAVTRGSIAVDAIVTVAGGNIHYRNWQGQGAAKVLFAGILFSSLTWLFGHLPGKRLGFGGPQARTLIREWSRIIFTGDFSHIFGNMKKNHSVPGLAIAYQGDEMAPEKSVQGLAVLLDSAVEMMPVTWKGNPHSSWARHPGETVALIEEWLLSRGVVA